MFSIFLRNNLNIGRGHSSRTFDIYFFYILIKMFFIQKWTNSILYNKKIIFQYYIK